MGAEMTTNSNGLHKSSSNSMIFGVAGGMAEYFDVDPTLMRVAWVVLGLVSVGTALIAYIALAVVIPVDEPSDVQSTGDSPDISGLGIRESRKQRRRSLLAFVLISVGIIALAANFGLFGWWRWDVLWPLVLIAVGGWILLARYRRRA